MTEFKNKVVFAGAGPGATDLITLRGKKAVENADVIIYAGSLVNPEILRFAKKECVIHDSASLALGEIIGIMQENVAKGLKVLRLHTGDPGIYGAIAEQMNELDRQGIEYEIIPGVSSVFAAAAVLKTELTMPGTTQTVILTRQAGRTPVPEKESIRALSTHQATMALFLSVSKIGQLVDDLLAGGYPEETAIGVVYRATWDNEKTIRGTLADIVKKVEDSQISRQAMIIVGDAQKKSGEYSKLYDGGFSHGYRSDQGNGK